MTFHKVIGLEIHIALASNQKCFSITPINEVSWTSLGLIGTMPQINFDAIKKSIILANALKMQINHEKITFDRKNYFYFDLPKGYQITQFFNPIGTIGHITLNNNKKIRIKQIHLEEDTAKQTKLDTAIALSFERLGAPLLEVVTEADFSSFEEVEEFLKTLKSMCIFLKISSCKYEKGEIRVDLNISMQHKPGELILPKQEVKNLNSIKAISKSIAFLEKELTHSLIKKEEPSSYTYAWVEKTESCVRQRKKLDSQEYFYIPEGNIPPIHLPATQLKEMLSQEKDFFEFKNELTNSELQTKEIDNLLTNFEILNNVLSLNKELKNWKKSYIWIANTLQGVLNSSPNKTYSFEEVQKLIVEIESKKINNSKNSKLMIKEIIDNKLTAKESLKLHLVEESVDTTKIHTLIIEILNKNEEQLKKLSQNPLKLEKFVLGELMKQKKKKVNAQTATKIFQENIDSYLKTKNLKLNT